MLLGTTVIFSVVALSAPRQQIDIPAGRADKMLAEWTRQARDSDIQVLYVSTNLKSHQTKAVRCFCVPVTALAQMIEGTPIMLTGSEVENAPTYYEASDPVVRLIFGYPVCRPSDGASAPLPPCRSSPEPLEFPPWWRRLVADPLGPQKLRAMNTFMSR